MSRDGSFAAGGRTNNVYTNPHNTPKLLLVPV